MESLIGCVRLVTYVIKAIAVWRARVVCAVELNQYALESFVRAVCCMNRFEFLCNKYYIILFQKKYVEYQVTTHVSQYKEFKWRQFARRAPVASG